MSKTSVILTIEHDQRIDLTSDGKAVRGHETYIREYVGMLESGLMARLSNAAYKTLHALALRACILGDPRRAGAEEEFQELERLGIVSNEDRGLLFCFPSRERLMQDTGIGSVHTVDSSLDELAELKIVKRITPAQPRLTRGLFGSNIYIIHPESFIRKFSADDGEQKVLPVNGDGEQKVLPDSEGTGSSFCPLKINNKGDQQEEEQDEIIAGHFAASVGIASYELSEKEKRKIATLLAERYTVEQICAGITSAVTRATQTGRQIRSLAYCLPAVRDVETSRRGVSTVQAAERKAEMGSPQPNRKRTLAAVTGQPQAVIQPNPERQSKDDLEKLAGGDAELRDLLEVVQERNPSRALQKSDVRAWQAIAERFRDLARARGATPIGLVMQAVLKAIGSHSDRDGYFAPRLAETILEEWRRSETEKKQQAVEQPQGVESEHRGLRSERRASNAVLPSFQTPDGVMDASQVWEMALGELKGQITKATFDTWVRPTFVVEARDGDQPTLVIGTRSPYAVEWLEHRLHTTIQRTVVGIVGKNVTVKFSAIVR